MIKEEYKNGCRLKEQVKYNIDYDDCQILNLTCANYIYDLVQESSKYETKLEDIKKMLYMIEKLLGHEVQYDIPEYHGDNKKCYFGVVSDNFVIIGNTFNRQMIFDPSDNYVVKNRKDAGTLAPIFNISSTISNGTTLITGNTLINPQLYLPAVYTNNPNLIVSKGNNHSIFENKSSDPTLNYMQCGDIKATQNAPIIKNTLGEFNRLQIVKTSQQKKQSEALNHYTFDGTSVFDTDNIKPTWVYKETWYDSNGNPAYAEKTGTQYQRPANVKMGFYYFDTSLNKPIWKNSDTENVWIDATGATV